MKSRFALPDLNIELDGAPVEGQALRGLEEVRVAQRLSLPTQCELVFRDPPGPLEVVASLTPGTALRITIRGQSESLFTGEITALEYVYGPANQREVLVRAYDKLHRLRKRQPVRAHVQETLDDLAGDLVADLGLAVQGSGQPIQWQRIIQYRQTDLDLLVEIAERCGVYLSLREDTLRLLTLEGAGEPQRLTLGEDLFEARVTVNGDPATRAVTVEGWDPLHVVTHSGDGSAPRSGRSTPASAPPDLFSETGERRFSDEIAQDDRHAQALAQAELDARAAREVVLWAVAEGDPALAPGVLVEVSGIAATLAGRYVLTAVTHRIDAQVGFVSEISTEPPQPRPRTRGSALALGVVTGVADPEGIGRVKVRLPTYNDVETEWMGVLCAAAGAGKGLIMLPDVGDQVLVLFPREDPAEGIVLGGLYGIKGPPDSGVEGESVLRYTLLTEGGQRVILDDGRKSIHLEDSTGSRLDLSPQRVFLHAAVDLEIEAPGKGIVIRGQSIDFERG